MWFFVDDQLADNRKVRKAGTAAIGLWVRCGAWAAGNLTDGFVPADIAARYGTPRQAQKLVDAGLWERAERDGETGYQFHDWTDYQKTREQVRARREADVKRQQRSRQRANTERETPKTAPQSGGAVWGVNEHQSNDRTESQFSEKTQVSEDCHGVTHSVSNGCPLPSPPVVPNGTTTTTTRVRARDVDLKELSNTAHVPKAHQIVEAWNTSHGRTYPTRTIRDLAKQVDIMLADRGQPEIITAALELWHQKPDAAPGFLPYLYTTALRTEAAKTAPAAAPAGPSKADAYRALAEEMRREEVAAQHALGARRGPIGIVIDGEPA
ncbi:hypothetical protein [Saccharopolyspora pogona]|uniref:hypothetical protein n=1 Tax=Saccharopolyspora pogona TaxID=333966 RepID=UPI0016839213|nr:hypothetical protein [Saccharopolyspora pogona]